MSLLQKFLYFFLMTFFSVNLFSTENQKSVVRQAHHPEQSRRETYTRIISLSPSITEFLYEFGVSDRIVGVTRFCKYPEDAKNKESIGGLLDPNFEQIYRLNPDLIIHHEGATDHEQRFKDMNLNALKIVSTSMKGILDSIDAIGAALNRESRAAQIKAKIQAKIDYIQSKSRGLSKPRVLITYWRPLGEGQITEAYIAGTNTFFNDLIHISGGVNAYQGPKIIISPIVSAEAILVMNPDVIIEIKGTLQETGLSVDDVLDDWKNLSLLDAYKNEHIYILDKDYTGIPGPRIARTLQNIAECIHPYVDWE